MITNLPNGAESIFGYANGSLIVISAAPASKTPQRDKVSARMTRIVAVAIHKSDGK
jgi:hypothetical protein